jgi:RNA ligase
MQYDFPVILTLDSVLPAIEGREDFKVMEKDDFIVVDYMVAFNETFGTPHYPNTSIPQVPIYDPMDLIRRECRGLIFYKDGKLAVRGLHKFFNANEKPETKLDKLDLTQEHWILDKLDGSCIRPFILNNEVYYATMAGAKPFHDDVKAHIDSYTNQYEQLIRLYDAYNVQLIFEWCSPENRIVIGYDKPQLILTSAREKATGEYITYEDLVSIADFWDIPVVKAYEGSFENMEKLVEYTRGLEDVEGFVVQFKDGHRVKIKGDWYCQLHKVRSYFDYEKDVAKLILDGNIDDLIPMMLPDQVEKLRKFEAQLQLDIIRDLGMIYLRKGMINAYGITRKDFAINSTETPSSVRSVIFHNWNDLKTVSDEILHEDLIKAYVNATTSHARWRDHKKNNGMVLEW